MPGAGQDHRCQLERICVIVDNQNIRHFRTPSDCEDNGPECHSAARVQWWYSMPKTISRPARLVTSFKRNVMNRVTFGTSQLQRKYRHSHRRVPFSTAVSVPGTGWNRPNLFTMR